MDKADKGIKRMGWKLIYFLENQYMLDFEKEFVQYGKYHHNKINQIIHLLFVPLISWTVLIGLSPFKLQVYDWTLQASTALVSVYGIYYILLEPLTGILYAPFLYGLWYSAGEFHSWDLYGFTPMQVAGVLHLSSWIFQIGGHFLFEKRAPAFMDNLFQAFALAPLFVFCE